MKVRICLGLTLWLLAAGEGFSQGGAVPQLDGLKTFSAPDQQQGYRQTWALVIGINYEGRTDLTETKDRLALPELLNAEEDAEAIYDFLISHYGYKADENIEKLTGKAATHQAINAWIAKIKDSKNVTEDDSLFLFFAGHGVRLEGSQRDRVAIFPYDVELSNGVPINREIRLYSDLFEKLRDSKARHKLVVLDSCYSGDILKAGFHSPSEIADRSSPILFQQPTFQAIASCRAFELASDGKINSPFTKAFLKGLQQLPARESYEDGLWADRLFSYLYPELKGQTEEQEPQFGVLDGDGEFRFFPAPEANFTKYRTQLDEQKLLHAILMSPEGNWWFSETPWFIPSIRQQVLNQVFAKRGGTALISRDDLRDITKDIVDRSSNGDAAEASPLLKMRYAHAKLLLEAEGTSRFQATLEEILAALESSPLNKTFEPADLHYQAILQHVLKHDEAGASYERAIGMYQSRGKVESRQDKAMLALCLADYGEYLANTQAAPRDAADTYRQADRVFGSEAPAAFRVFILCREADAWLKLNRWAIVDERLLEARRLVETSGSELASLVYRRLAWARMIQWKISNAEHWFSMSNRVLSQSHDDSQSDSPAATAIAPADSQPQLSLRSDVFMVDDNFRYWDSYDAKVAYLHNLHGLAMAQRFHGRPAFAAQKYRWLAARVEDALTHLREDAGSAESDAERKLYGRLINTLERLGDCNLFGSPEERDLKEALDDYRRAGSRCHRVSTNLARGPRTQLLYKQALALALPSDVQDTQLAMAICQEADATYAQAYVIEDDSEDATGKVDANGMILALGRLTTKTVALIHAGRGSAKADQDPLPLATADLRAAIHAFRDENGPDLHRDQLELCLFASKVLLDHGGEQNPFDLNEDTELLLGLCRMALSPHPTAYSTDGGRGETRAYLRTYYDTAIRNKLRADPDPKHVKDLLEIQYEATLGIRYVKPEVAVPTLAMYVLDDQLLLLMDMPRGASKCLSLNDDYELDEVLAACDSTAERLKLPRPADRALQAWRQQNTTGTDPVLVELRWADPVRGFDETTMSIRPSDDTSRSGKFDTRVFPFELPSGVQDIAMRYASEETQEPQVAAEK